MVITAPFHGEPPAGLDDGDAALRPARARCRHRSGAGGRTAGPGQARPALPSPHDDLVFRNHLSDRNIGALGKDRMVFQQRAEPVELVAPHVLVDPEDRVRIAHRGGRRGMQHRRVDRPDLQFDGARVGEFLGERDPVPFEARLAHVDRDRAVAMVLRVQNAGDGLEGEQPLAGFGGERLHDAAHAVAAGLRRRAVGVQYVNEVIGAGRARIVDRHHLVELCRRVGVERYRRLTGHARGRAAHIGDDDLVAEPVHLGELHPCGHRGCLPHSVGRYMAEQPGNYQCGPVTRWRRRRG